MTLLGPRPRILAGLCTISLLAACASRPMPPPQAEPDIGRGLGQPLRDLSLIRETAPDILLRAAAAPYSLDGLGDCAGGAGRNRRPRRGARTGPGAQRQGRRGRHQWRGGRLVGGAVGLPFRGVVRVVTGAQVRKPPCAPLCWL